MHKVVMCFFSSPGRSLSLSIIALLFAGLAGPAIFMKINRDGGFEKYGWEIDLSSWPKTVIDIGDQPRIRTNLFEVSGNISQQILWINTGQWVTFKRVPATSATKFISDVRVHEAWNPDTSVNGVKFRVRVSSREKYIDSIVELTGDRLAANQWVTISQDLSEFSGQKVSIEIAPLSSEPGVWTLWRAPKIVTN
ncbi:hypothetical protein ACQR3P_30490 [Rhodococcus sp. IEGM1300]